MMTRRAFLKLLALMLAWPPRFADSVYWQIGESALGIDTRLSPPESAPVFRLWVPYAGR